MRPWMSGRAPWPPSHSGWSDTRPGIALLIAALLLVCACDDGFHLKVTIRVNLGVSPDVAASGATIEFIFSNRGEVVVRPEGAVFELVVTDPSGAEVRRLADPAGNARLAPGDVLSVTWDQKDGAGLQVAPADYEVTVRYVADGEVRSRATGFTIR